MNATLTFRCPSHEDVFIIPSFVAGREPWLLITYVAKLFARFKYIDHIESQAASDDNSTSVGEPHGNLPKSLQWTPGQSARAFFAKLVVKCPLT